MKIIAIDIPLGIVKSLDIPWYFNKLLSEKRKDIIKDNFVDKFQILLPPSQTYTLGLLSVITALSVNGHTVKYMHFEDTSEFFGELSCLVMDYDMVLFSCKTTTYNTALRLCGHIKSLKPNIISVFGGVHITALPESVISEKEVDYIVIGEGEISLLTILDKIESGSEIERVNGIGYKDTKGNIIINKKFDLINNISQLPTVLYEDFLGDLNMYHNYVETSRGCCYECSFCGNPLLWKKKIRCFSADKTYKLLQTLSTKLHPNTLVHLVDPSYGNSNEMELLCEMLVQKPLNIYFSCDINIIQVNERRIKKMYSAGVRMFCIGIESMCDNILNFNKKPQTSKKVIEACEIIRATSDSFIKSYWIVGLPGENENSAKRSRDYAVEMLNKNLIDLVCEHVFVAYPGCDVYTNLGEYNFVIEHHNWDNYDSRSFPLPGESKNFSMEQVLIAYLDFLRAQCEYYGLSDRDSLRKNVSEYTFTKFKGGMI